MKRSNGQPSGEPIEVQQLRQERRNLAELGAALPSTALARYAEQFGAQTEWPESLRGTPVIIDTDIGCDPDDALAVAAAARTVPELALVVTADETGPTYGAGQRARLARWLLDALDRHDVPVAEGASRGDTPYYCMDGLIPDGVPRQQADFIAAVRAVCQTTSGPVRWVGMGPLGNLAEIVRSAPDLLPRLRVTQMGGALAASLNGRGEHNIRVDVACVREVLAAVDAGQLEVPEFVTADVTYTPEIGINADSPLYRRLRDPSAPAWAGILAIQLERFFERFYPETMQHDPLALTAALNLPFVHPRQFTVAVDDGGVMTENEVGTRLWMSVSARYPLFMNWLTAALDPHTPPRQPKGPEPAQRT